MTDLFAGALRRLATSTSADLAYPLAQLPSLGAIAIPLAIAQLVAVRIADRRRR